MYGNLSCEGKGIFKSVEGSIEGNETHGPNLVRKKL